MKLYVIIQIISTFFVSTVLGVDEIGILTVYLQYVENHLPYQHGQRQNLAEDRMAAQLFWRGDIQGYADSQ